MVSHRPLERQQWYSYAAERATCKVAFGCTYMARRNARGQFYKTRINDKLQGAWRSPTAVLSLRSHQNGSSG